MSTFIAQSVQPLDLEGLRAALNGPVGRLLLACALGALIGLEREAKHRAAGVRTNMLICMGCAFFTILSSDSCGRLCRQKPRSLEHRPGHWVSWRGLILHNRNRISGLTSCGQRLCCCLHRHGVRRRNLCRGHCCGRYRPDRSARSLDSSNAAPTLRTSRWSTKSRGRDQTAMLKSILDAMDKAGQRFANPELDAIGDLQRVCFMLAATKKEHDRLRTQLLAEPAIDTLFSFRDPEED